MPQALPVLRTRHCLTISALHCLCTPLLPPPLHPAASPAPQLPRRLSQLCTSALSQGAIYFDPDRTSSFLQPTLQATISQALSSSSSSKQHPSSSGSSGSGSLGGSAGLSRNATPEPGKLLLLRPLLHELRLVKSAAEARRMRLAAEAAVGGITACMQMTAPGVTEHRLAAHFGAWGMGEAWVKEQKEVCWVLFWCKGHRRRG